MCTQKLNLPSPKNRSRCISSCCLLSAHSWLFHKSNKDQLISLMNLKPVLVAIARNKTQSSGRLSMRDMNRVEKSSSALMKHKTHDDHYKNGENEPKLLFNSLFKMQLVSRWGKNDHTSNKVWNWNQLLIVFAKKEKAVWVFYLNSFDWFWAKKWTTNCYLLKMDNKSQRIRTNVDNQKTNFSKSLIALQKLGENVLIIYSIIDMTIFMMITIYTLYVI